VARNRGPTTEHSLADPGGRSTFPPSGGASEIPGSSGENGPAWRGCFRLAIPAVALRGANLVTEIAIAGTIPFAGTTGRLYATWTRILSFRCSGANIQTSAQEQSGGQWVDGQYREASLRRSRNPQ